MIQFLNSLQQILRSDSVGTFEGVCRHFHWQWRKVFHDFPCELTIGGSTLLADRPSGVAALVNAMGEYDFNNMSFLRELLNRFGGTFVDVGANIGAYTLVASEAQKARVISVEPHPVTFALLTQNVERNARSNVACLNLALSNCDRELRLTDEAGSATNRIIEGDGRTPGAGVLVSARRFDTLCRDLKSSPDFIKIDVEGYERAVLEGFGEFGSAAKLILIEGGERLCVRHWMAAAGYEGPWFVHFNKRVLSTKSQPRPEDPVYVRQDFLTELLNMKFQVLQVPAYGTRAILGPRCAHGPS
jgi:FkbM family methyltransferase